MLCKEKLKIESNGWNLAIYRERKLRQTKKYAVWEHLPRLVKGHAT